MSAYEDANAFKLFCVDVGLLGALAHLDARIIADDLRLFNEFNGAYTEQYVCQQLVGLAMLPTYWSSARGRSEVDLAVEIADTAVPIEVMGAENLQAKSLKVVRSRYRLNRCVRTSLSDYRDEGWLVNVPLWVIGTNIWNSIIA